MSTQPFLLAILLLLLDVLHFLKVLIYDSLKGLRVLLTDETKEMRKYYAGKTVLITGASSGLGKELALQLSKLSALNRDADSKGGAGYGTVHLVLSARNKSQLDAVATSCRQLSPNSKVMVIPLDLANLVEGPGGTLEAYMCSVTAALTAHGLPPAIHVLLNNAGVSSRGLAVQTSQAVLRDIMDVNFFGPVALTKALIPLLLAGAGASNSTATASSLGRMCAIGVVSSVQGRIGIPQRTSYAASKHAVQGYFDCLRGELHATGAGITVTVVSPGYINTSLSQNAITANGEAYGVTDATTKNGMDAQWAARKTLYAVSAGETDFILADAKTVGAIQARSQFPALLHKMVRSKN
jgi:short-subunit dehydrogenase